MTGSWLVLTPPIIVLAIALITKKLNPALITGIICSAFIATNFSPVESTKLIGVQLWNNITELDSICIYLFLIALGTVVALVIHAGGAAAFTRFASKKLKNDRQAETTSLLFSFSLFIDDYLSNSTVGHVMRPLTDQFKVTRAKLAFLVHSIATPLVVIAPISGWSAMITHRLGQEKISTQMLENTAIAANPYLVYIQSIPFIFYSFLMLISVWFIVRRRISYGPMKTHETIAQKTGNLLGGEKIDPAHVAESLKHDKGTLADLFVPLITLICSITVATLTTGKLVTALGIDKFVGPSFLALLLAGSFTLLVSFPFFLYRKRISASGIPKAFLHGFEIMKDPIIMLFLASTLGLLIRENLGTGTYLAYLMEGNVSLALIPLMLFITSATIAIATGTSWGTIAVMMPIAIPMIVSLSQVSLPAELSSVVLLLPAIGAVLSGAVCGDHISPVSETTIMAASSAGSTPVAHAVTQFFYALPAVLCTCLAFLLCGFLINYGTLISSGISIGVSLAICLALLFILGRKKR